MEAGFLSKSVRGLYQEKYLMLDHRPKNPTAPSTVIEVLLATVAKPTCEMLPGNRCSNESFVIGYSSITK